MERAILFATMTTLVGTIPFSEGDALPEIEIYEKNIPRQNLK